MTAPEYVSPEDPDDETQALIDAEPWTDPALQPGWVPPEPRPRFPEPPQTRWEMTRGFGWY